MKSRGAGCAGYAFAYPMFGPWGMKIWNCTIQYLRLISSIVHLTHLANTGTAWSYYMDFYSQSGKSKDLNCLFRVYLIWFTKENMFNKIFNKFLFVASSYLFPVNLSHNSLHIFFHLALRRKNWLLLLSMLPIVTPNF